MSKFTALLGILLAPALWPQELAGGPYTVHVGPRQGTIMWIVKDAAGLRAQRVTLGNLAPNRRYDYDVMGRDAGKGSFKSAPETRASFTFAVFGDTRSRHEMHQRVVDALVQESPDFVVHTGDLVSDGRELEQWPRFFQIEKELLRRAAFFPVLGNHERNSPRFHEFFDIESPYYSFAWGAAHFTLLNSDVGNAVKSAEERAAWWAEQVRWLEEDLAKARGADFRFVVLHHPPMTAVKRRLGQNEHVQELIPLFERHRVHAVFAGHDHNY